MNGISFFSRRLVMAAPVVIGVITLVFSIIHLVPGDPAKVVAGPWATEEDVEAIRRSLHLDEPLYVQYLLYLGKLAHGDLGRSNITGLSVAEEVAARFPVTIMLTASSMLIAIGLGIPLGLVAAIRRNTAVDYLGSILALVGLSLPSFWLGLILILVFSENLHVLPSMGMGGPTHWILPSLTLGAAVIAMLSKIMRAAVLEVVDEDYVRTARAKGLQESAILYKHILKNAMIPVITIIGLRVGYLLGGSMVVETVFSLPGLGRLVVNAVLNRDLPVVQGGVLVISLSFVLVNLAVDLLYTWLDPRIQSQG